MNKTISIIGLSIIVSFFISCTSNTLNQESGNIENSDPLPSWNDGETKTAIISYVKDVTNPKSENFIPISERISTFDNDGTLWSEQLMYFQLFFAIDRVKALASEHPEWKNEQPFKAVIENDMDALIKQGKQGLIKIMVAAHAGNTTDEFEEIVKEWISTAKHPTLNKPYTDLVYQPMLELLNYLRANNFKTFIVSGGGIELMRPWVEEVYGIPRDQVVGSSIKVKYDYNDGNPVIRRLPALDFVDDKEGKPEAIHKYIGRKPVFAGGNSDGDLEMLRWTASNDYKGFMLYVHHTDSIREWAYDRESHFGQFNKGWDEAIKNDWTVIDMKKDWKVIYPFQL